MKSLIIKSFLSLAFLAFTFAAEASHFRYGTVKYQILSETGVGPAKQTVVQFTFNQSWRGDAFGAFPAVGTVYPAGTLYDMYWDFGDGSPTAYWTYTVTATNLADNWISGNGTLTHTYTGNVDVVAHWDNCCRIGSLVNNSNGSMRQECNVTLSQTNNASPQSSLPPIVNVPDNVALHTFNLSATDPNGDALSYALSTTAQSALFVTSPSFYTSVSAAGVVSLNTTGAGISDGQLYAIQFMITDSKGATTPLDFIMKITSALPNNAPQFVAPTPANNSIINATVGVPMSFTVSASDADVVDLVTLNASGVPAGAVFTPGAPANPVSTMFSWTPTLADVGGHAISFTATDNNAGQAITNVNITVAGGGPCMTLTMETGGVKNSNFSTHGAGDDMTYYNGISASKGFQVCVSGGVAPYTAVWSSTDGTLQQFGNKCDIAGAKATVIYPSGAFDVSVTVTDANGCVATETMMIGFVDYTCGTPGTAWSYTLCEVGTGITSCVATTNAASALLGTGNYELGSCAPKTGIEAAAVDFTVYPNPSSGMVTVRYNAAQSTSGMINVLDLNGRVIESSEITLNQGNVEYGLDLTGITNGMYFIQLVTDNDVQTQRIQVLK